MAEIAKTAPQTQKVWTAQDFRERNKRVEDERRKQAKDKVESELIPRFIEKMNNYYNSNEPNIHSINLITKGGDTNSYVIEFIDEWATSLGYELEECRNEIYLRIPNEPATEEPETPATDKPETEKYEDS